MAEIKEIGMVKGSFGLKGDFILAGTPKGLNAISIGSSIGIGFSSSFLQNYTLENIKKNKDTFKIKLKGIDTPEKANELKNKAAFIDISQLDEEANEYFLNSPLDYTAFYESGKEIGKIVDVWEMPANDVLVIETEKGDLPYPYVDKFIISKDNEKKIFVLVEIEGLEDLIE